MYFWYLILVALFSMMLGLCIQEFKGCIDLICHMLPHSTQHCEKNTVTVARNCFQQPEQDPKVRFHEYIGQQFPIFNDVGSLRSGV